MTKTKLYHSPVKMILILPNKNFYDLIEPSEINSWKEKDQRKNLIPKDQIWNQP